MVVRILSVSDTETVDCFAFRFSNIILVAAHIGSMGPRLCTMSRGGQIGSRGSLFPWAFCFWLTEGKERGGKIRGIDAELSAFG